MRDDYYDILGVTSDATAKEVTRAYRKLSLQFHPDKVAAAAGNSRGDKCASAAAEEAFTLVREAYVVLSDRSARRKYDLRAIWISSHPEQNRLAASRNVKRAHSPVAVSAFERPTLAATMPVNQAGSWLGKGQSQGASCGKVTPGPWPLVIGQEGTAGQVARGGASGNRKLKGLSMSSSAGSFKLPRAGRPPHGSVSLKPLAATNLTSLGGAVHCSADSSAGLSSAAVQLWGASGLKSSGPGSPTSRGGALRFGLTCPAGFSFQAVQQTRLQPDSLDRF